MTDFSSIIDAKAEASGGAIYMQGRGTLIMANACSIVRASSNTFSGGAIQAGADYAKAATLLVTNGSVLMDCSTYGYGGSIFVGPYYGYPTSEVILSNDSSIVNSIARNGGA
eukprot:2179608-Prymnesium_polylepis.1